jgi:glycerophosphoryl diester phosphodiesterase
MDRNRSGTVGRRTFVKGTGAALGATALGTGVAAGGNDGETASDTDLPFAESADPIVIAHRGFAGRYPENTIAAGVGAGLAGADAVEIDVVPTADGTVVVFHDDGLGERADGGLTGEEGLIWKTETETVLDAEVLESGETVPTFEAFMDAIPTSLGVNIELKNPGSTEMVTSRNFEGEALTEQEDLWRAFTGDVLDIATEYDNEIIVSSFSEAAISVTREYDDSIPVAYLLYDSIERGLEIAREYDCEAIHPPYDMIRGTPLFNTGAYIDDPGYEDIDLVEVAHQEDRAVNVYTVGTWYQAEQLAAAGVDGLINDYPGLLVASDADGEN